MKYSKRLRTDAFRAELWTHLLLNVKPRARNVYAMLGDAFLTKMPCLRLGIL